MKTQDLREWGRGHLGIAVFIVWAALEMGLGGHKQGAGS